MPKITFCIFSYSEEKHSETVGITD